MFAVELPSTLATTIVLILKTFPLEAALVTSVVALVLGEPDTLFSCDCTYINYVWCDMIENLLVFIY